MDVTDREAKKRIAFHLRQLRGDRSLRSIAEVVGTSAGAIRDIENGERMPGVGLLSRIADCFNRPMEDFLKPVPSRRAASA